MIACDSIRTLVVITFPVKMVSYGKGSSILALQLLDN